MVEVDKCKRCIRISRAWHGRELAKIAEKYDKDHALRLDWDEAGKNCDLLEEGEEIDWTTPKGVQILKRCGVRMELVFWFLAIVDFHRLYGIEPTACGLTLSKFDDEFFAEVLSGVLVKPSTGADPPFPFRRIVLWSEKLQLLQEEVLHPAKRLREDEPKETFEKLTKDAQKELPKDP